MLKKAANLLQWILPLVMLLALVSGFTLRLVFPTAIDLQASTDHCAVPPLPNAKLNINLASEWELDQLPGIGPAIAQRIVEYRRTYGPFQSIGELIHVKGIGEKTLEDLKPYITIGE
jgi:competence protein ComEA